LDFTTLANGHDKVNTGTPSSGPPPRPRRENYAERQARLDAEAVERWVAIVAGWPPMTDEQISALAVILNRIDARHTEHTTNPPR
jgi:hypothetical protein